jgi:negative regulator of flagellin synthesis FlgM
MTDPISTIARATGLDVAAEAKVRKAEDDKLSAATDRAASAARPADDGVVLSGVVEKAMAEPDINAEKVEAIKKAIREGNYPLDPRGIAASFLALESIVS